MAASKFNFFAFFIIFSINFYATPTFLADFRTHILENVHIFFNFLVSSCFSINCYASIILGQSPKNLKTSSSLK